jgi:hypothetical protein
MATPLRRAALGLGAATLLVGATTLDAVATVDPVQEALSQAASSGAAVQVASLTDENSTTVANPDGSFTTSITSGPSNVQRDGAWVPIDTSLVAEGGVLKPKASRAKVEVSAGGNDTLAKLTDDQGRVFSLQWPTALPAPVVKDNVATFANAAGPGASRCGRRA